MWSMSERHFMIFITFSEWSIWDTIVIFYWLVLLLLTSALYKILGVKHSFSKGHSSLLLQLHPYSLLFEFNICLLCDDIIDPILDKQLWLIFILLNMVYIGWVDGNDFEVIWKRGVVPNNSMFTFSSLICYVYIICLLTLIIVLLFHQSHYFLMLLGIYQHSYQKRSYCMIYLLSS